MVPFNRLRPLRQVNDPGGSPPPAGDLFGPDGQPWDPARAMTTIETLRAENKALKARAATVGEAEALRKVVGEATGRKDADSATLAAHVRRLALAPTLLRVSAGLRVDADLADALLARAGLLDGLDLAADDLRDQVEGIVVELARQHPNIRIAGAAPASGIPIPGGSGGFGPVIRREDLAHMDPAEIEAARKAGMLEHLGVGR